MQTGNVPHSTNQDDGETPSCKHLSVVMPAYNEEANIEAVILDHVRALEVLRDTIRNWEIVCLDDASTDNTHAILERLAKRVPGLRVLRHTSNEGIYRAFADVQNAALGDYIYATGSDGQWPARNLITMWETLQSSNADLVVGVRHNRREIYGPWRLLVSRLFNLLPVVLFGVKTMDAGSIKLGRRNHFQTALLSRSPFVEAERIIRTKRMNQTVEFVPIECTARSAGKATGARWDYIVGSLRDCMRCLVRYGLRQQ